MSKILDSELEELATRWIIIIWKTVPYKVDAGVKYSLCVHISFFNRLNHLHWIDPLYDQGLVYHTILFYVFAYHYKENHLTTARNTSVFSLFNSFFQPFPHVTAILTRTTAVTDSQYDETPHRVRLQCSLHHVVEARQRRELRHRWKRRLCASIPESARFRHGGRGGRSSKGERGRGSRRRWKDEIPKRKLRSRLGLTSGLDASRNSTGESAECSIYGTCTIDLNRGSSVAKKSRQFSPGESNDAKPTKGRNEKKCFKESNQTETTTDAAVTIFEKSIYPPSDPIQILRKISRLHNHCSIST